MLYKRTFLAFALMSAFANVVNAAALTSKTKIESADSVKIMAALPTAGLTEEDKTMIKSILRFGTMESGIAEDDGLFQGVRYGDSCIAYLEKKDGDFYLVYEVTSPEGKLRGTARIKVK